MQKWIHGLAALVCSLATEAAPVITTTGGTWTPGQSVTVTLQSSEALPDTQGFLFDLSYDSNLLSYDGFSFGPLFTHWAGDVYDVDPDPSDSLGALTGSFFVDLSVTNSPLLAGNATLLGLHFLVKDPTFRGDTQVSLSCLPSGDPAAPCVDVAFEPLQASLRVEERSNNIPAPAPLPLAATAGALWWLVHRRRTAAARASR